MLLALIGLMRLARATRTRWEPVSLVAGATLTVIGFELPAASVAFLLGILVLVVTLLKGSRPSLRLPAEAPGDEGGPQGEVGRDYMD